MDAVRRRGHRALRILGVDWGVEVHKMGGEKHILGSDRDRGLRIFQYQAGYVGDGQ